MSGQLLERYNDSSSLKDVKIDRWLGFRPNAIAHELHGYADSSKSAYDLVVNLRIFSENKVRVHLLQDKTKVALIKPLLTIPRLEFCAAVLLAKLVHKIINAIGIEDLSVNFWSDSTDVLFWLRDRPSRWPTFVANRCSLIHTAVPSAT